MKNYYDILGVPESASSKQIQAAYRGLAKKYHPDVKRGSDEAFKDIVVAYETLQDPNKRKTYNLSLAQAGISESKTIIENIFSCYFLSICAGVCYIYAAILLASTILLDNVYPGLTIPAAILFFLCGIYLSYRSSKT